MQDIDHGRLFRVAPPGTPYSVPKFELKNPNGAIAALQSPNLAWRYLGWQALKGFGDKAAPALQKMFETAAPHHRARALWVFAKLDVPADKKIGAIRAGLKSPNADLRVTAIRLMREVRGEVELKELVGDLNFDDPAPEVRREILLGLRDVQPENLEKHWAVLANSYDGQDRWYLEALGIAAEGHWDECLSEWMSLNGGKVKGRAARDIIWRSRASQTAKMLADAIGDPETETDQLPRLFRALDFQKGPGAEKAIQSLAFTPQKGDEARQTLIASEAISRVKGADLSSKPEMKAALDKVLAKNAGTVQFVRLVEKFNLTDRYPEVMAAIQQNPESQASVEAVKILVEKGDLLKKALAGDDVAKVVATIKALAAAKENKTVGLLMPLVRDKTRGDAIRREAVAALAASRAGSKQLTTLAEENKFDPALKEAVAVALHGSPDPDTRALANKLFPLAPGKDNKPLPPLAELATRKGDVTNGRIVFHTTGTCIQCHQVNGLGKEVGPNLSEIGKKLTKQALFESILYPSAGISHNFESWIVATVDGNLYTGLITSETADEIVMKDAKSIITTIKKSNIEQRKKSETSLMPADLQKVISEKELVDVVEFMTTLKEAQASTAGK
jgi:putative heme-binding domain-containing protein